MMIRNYLWTLGKDGKPLSQDRGAPLRVIAPFRLAYKSISSSTGLSSRRRSNSAGDAGEPSIQLGRSYPSKGEGRDGLIDPPTCPNVRSFRM